MERFLYRLGESKHRDKVILKGALMFVVWKAPRSRSTRDIDLLGQLENSVDRLIQVARDTCEVKVESDGMVFNPKTVRGETIIAGDEYSGVRLNLTGFLARARAAIQIDVGFGDVVSPKPTFVDYPSLLGYPAPHLKGYPRETVVAEKLHTVAKHGLVNTRMKDFYDLALLANLFDFEGSSLGQAITNTYSARETVLSAELPAFSKDFVESPEKKAQWITFVKRSRLDGAPKDLKIVIEQIKPFALPIIKAIKDGQQNKLNWKAPGPWVKRN